MEKDSAASLERVTKSFGGQIVLRNITLKVAPGEIVGIVGSNGSGKTTLLRVLVGLIHQDSGLVRLGAQTLRSGLVERRIVYFAGGSTLPDTLQVRRWARLFDTAGPPSRDRRRMGKLSRGQRQLVGLRVALARSRLHLVVLDEPWEGLDPDGAEWLSRTLVQKRLDGAAIIASSHRFADLGHVGDRYVVLHQGALYDVPDKPRVARVLVDSHLVESYRRVTRRSR